VGRIIAFSYILPIVCFLVFCLKNTKKELWVIFFYIILSLGFDFFRFLLHLENETVYSIVNGIFTICEYTIFAYFFFTVINTPITKKILAIVSIIMFLLIVIIFISSNKRNFDSASASIESITIIVFSLIYLFRQINQPQEHFIFLSPNFWVVLGILIYMSGTLFLFIMASNLSDTELQKYWIIINISNAITNIIFCIAFLVNRFAAPNPSAEKPYKDYNNIPENP